jgi:hypothetical protein
MKNNQPEDPSFDDFDEEGYQFCPHCGREYDEIDFEYQICHYCKREAE